MRRCPFGNDTFLPLLSFGVFLEYYAAAQTFPGYGSLQLSFVGGIAVGFSFILGPIINILIARFGVKIPLMAGVILTCLGLELASLATQYWHLILSQGVMFGLGSSLCFIPSIGIPSQYFNKKRGIATGLASSGSGIGGFVLSPVTRVLINSVGVYWCLRILGFICLGLGLIAVTFVKDRRDVKDLHFVPFDTSLFKKHPAFALYLAFGFIHLWGYIIPFFLVPDYAVKLGLSASLASWLVGIMAGVNAIGRIVLGQLADSFGRINLLLLSLTLASLASLFIWTFADSVGALVAYSIVFGMGCGGYWALGVPALAQIVGLQDLGSAMSILYLSNIIPPIVASSVASAIRNDTSYDTSAPYKQYRYAIIFSGLMLLAGCAILLVVRQIKANGRWLVKV